MPTVAVVTVAAPVTLSCCVSVTFCSLKVTVLACSIGQYTVLSSAATILDVCVRETVPVCTCIVVFWMVSEEVMYSRSLVPTCPPTAVVLMLVRLVAITFRLLLCVPRLDLPWIVTVPVAVIDCAVAPCWTTPLLVFRFYIMKRIGCMSPAVSPDTFVAEKVESTVNALAVAFYTIKESPVRAFTVTWVRKGYVTGTCCVGRKSALRL